MHEASKIAGVARETRNGRASTPGSLLYMLRISLTR